MGIGMQVEGAYKHDIWYQPLLLLLAFLLGSVMCGLVVVSNEVQFGKSSYGVALLANSGLLIAATFLADYDVAPYLAAIACGLQNGMCTMHFGAVVRTTHVTGLVTDLGLTIGRLWAVLFRAGCRCPRLSIVDRAQIDVDFLKLQVLTVLGVAFFVGCVVGAYLDTRVGAYAFLSSAHQAGPEINQRSSCKRGALGNATHSSKCDGQAGGFEVQASRKIFHPGRDWRHYTVHGRR